MIKKKQIYDGKWYRTKWNNCPVGCCDCGLVHFIDYKLSKDGKRLYRRVMVKDELTKESRKQFVFIATQYKNEPIEIKRL
jgi:hypothetical protein